MARTRHDVLAILGESWLCYGDLSRLAVPFSARRYLLVHPDQVKHVLLDNDANYRKTSMYRVIESVAGRIIFTAEGEAWRQRRRLDRPAFFRDRLAELGSIVAELGTSMLRRWADAARAGQAIDLPREMTILALSITARALYQTDAAVDFAAVAGGLPAAQRHLTRRMKGYPDVPDWLPLPSHQRFVRFRRTLKMLASRFVVERADRNDGPADLLRLLVRAGTDIESTPLTDDEVHSEVSAYLLAGLEIGHALTWAWYLLARHPWVEERLRGELAAVLGGRTPTIEDLPQLSYTEGDGVPGELTVIPTDLELHSRGDSGR